MGRWYNQPFYGRKFYYRGRWYIRAGGNVWSASAYVTRRYNRQELRSPRVGMRGPIVAEY